MRRFIDTWFDYAERSAHHAIARLPAGTLVNSGMHDPVQLFLPESLEITVKVAIDPAAGRIAVDLRDNPDCIDAGLNLTEVCATANCIQGVFENLEADISPNAGSFRCLDVKLREGCVVGIPRFPALLLPRHHQHGGRGGEPGAVITQLGDGHGLAQGNLCFSAGMGVVSGRDWRRGGAEYINQVYLMAAAIRPCLSTTA